MKFITDRYIGSDRHIVRFSFFPVTIGRMTRWLEIIGYKERFDGHRWKKLYFTDI